MCTPGSCVRAKAAQSCLTLCDPVDCSLTRLLCPWGFCRQEYCNGLPCPSPGDLPDPGIEPRSPVLQANSLLSESAGKQEGSRASLNTYSLFSECSAPASCSGTKSHGRLLSLTFLDLSPMSTPFFPSRPLPALCSACPWGMPLR